MLTASSAPFTLNELEGAKRKTLQRLAKACGFKANAKSVVLVEQLRGYWESVTSGKNKENARALNADTTTDIQRVLSTQSQQTEDDDSTSGEEDANEDAMMPNTTALPAVPITVPQVPPKPLVQEPVRASKPKSRKRSAPDWDKIHSKMFNTQKSIGVTASEKKKKRPRPLKVRATNQLTEVAARPMKKARAESADKITSAQSKNKPFRSTPVASSLMRPTVSSSKSRREKYRKPDSVPRSSSRPASAAASSKSKKERKFDLASSLKRKPTWKLKKGPLMR